MKICHNKRIVSAIIPLDATEYHSAKPDVPTLLEYAQLGPRSHFAQEMFASLVMVQAKDWSARDAYDVWAIINEKVINPEDFPDMMRQAMKNAEILYPAELQDIRRMSPRQLREFQRERFITDLELERLTGFYEHKWKDIQATLARVGLGGRFDLIDKGKSETAAA